jgi:hypothetical protein
MFHRTPCSLLGLLLATAAGATPLPGVFDTGVDDLGALLPSGGVDPHYVLVSSADPAFPGPSAFAADPIPFGFWVANGAASRWIAPSENEAFPSGGPPHPSGFYVYRLAVDLTGFDPGTAEIHGTFAADNSASILLNGSSTGQAVGGYASLVAFSITSGFVAGINDLDFVVANAVAGGVNPTGLRVQGIAGTGSAAVSVREETGATSYALSAPFPNPTRDLTNIHFALLRDGEVRLVVRDLSGRTVRTLLDGGGRAGRLQFSWDGRTADGSRAAAGVYFVELLAEGRRESRPVVLLR